MRYLLSVARFCEEDQIKWDLVCLPDQIFETRKKRIIKNTGTVGDGHEDHGSYERTSTDSINSGGDCQHQLDLESSSFNGAINIPQGFVHFHHQSSPKSVLKIDGYLLSGLLSELTRSDSYRKSFVTHQAKSLKATSVKVLIQMQTPFKDPLDILGNKLVTTFCSERRDMEYALSWLSTLGGAFSALGDLSLNYAQEAGKISFKQMKIALRLGDPLVAARCRLYAAISLLQRGQLKLARLVVEQEFRFARSLPQGQDPKLPRMCLGIWSKLQYHWSLRNSLKRIKNPKC